MEIRGVSPFGLYAMHSAFLLVLVSTKQLDSASGKKQNDYFLKLLMLVTLSLKC